ncbi:MAG: hypothetical protein ABF969_14795 [Sporolactobacillus sp.]
MSRWKKVSVVCVLCLCLTGFIQMRSSGLAHAEVQIQDHHTLFIRDSGGESSDRSIWDSIIKWWEQHR